jgi:hypothetical protein
MIKPATSRLIRSLSASAFISLIIDVYPVPLVRPALLVPVSYQQRMDRHP